MFIFISIVLGLFGAVSDIFVNKWIENQMSPKWWTISAISFVIFMTGLGFCIRIGTAKGHSFSGIVITIVLMNILGVLVWDLMKGQPLSVTKIVGVLLAIAAIICLEKK